MKDSILDEKVEAQPKQNRKWVFYIIFLLCAIIAWKGGYGFFMYTYDDNYLNLAYSILAYVILIVTSLVYFFRYRKEIKVYIYVAILGSYILCYPSLVLWFYERVIGLEMVSF